jgi:hypothetical protein
MDKETADKTSDSFFYYKKPGERNWAGTFDRIWVCKRHGGFIEIDSSSGKGCWMNMYLPTTSVPVSENHITDTIAQGSGNILVIDHELAIRDVLSSKNHLTVKRYQIYDVICYAEQIAKDKSICN